MNKLLAGTGLVLLTAIAAPALAQDKGGQSSLDAPQADTGARSSGNDGGVPDQAQGYEGSSGLDTPVDDTPAGASDAPQASSAAPAVAAPAKTGDPVMDRLNELEAKVAALEARNRQLEEQASETATRVEKVEVRAAKGVQINAPAPTFADMTDTFTFKPRGTFQLDYAAFNERAGGYDFSNGTDIRRARFGFDGTAFKAFKWRIEAEYVKGTVNLLDAYIQYIASPKWVLTVGQHKAPYGLEANSTDALNTFLERGMFTNAFGAVGAERRVGASIAYQTDKLNAAIGIYGGGETFQRANRIDETYGVNGRITWDPILDTGRLLHVGVSGFHTTNFATDTVTLADRPDTRVDGGNILSVALAPITTGAVANRTRGAKDATYVGAEAAGVYGPFSLQGEYGRLHVDRYDAVADLNFDGFYVFGTWFLTGESRSFKNGVVDRVKPFRNFGEGGPGAIELVARYDRLDLTDRDLSPLTRKATTLTGGFNWYLNPNTRFVFNYIWFKGLNSPLVAAPVATFGTTAKGEAFASRLQFDF